MKTNWKPLAVSCVAAALLWGRATPAKAWLDLPMSPNATFKWDWIPIPLPVYEPPIQTTSASGKGKHRGHSKSGPVSGKGEGVSRKRPSLVKTSFRPSNAVRKRNFARFVAKSRAADPEGADQLEQALGSGDIIAEMGKAIAPFGFKTNDVADAMTVYFASAWSGARGHNDNPTRAQSAGLRRQIAAAAQRTPSFAKATDAQKQELAEAMLIQALMIDQSVTAAKGKPEIMGKLKAAIVQGAQRTFGLDMRRVQLTDAGAKLTS